MRVRGRAGWAVAVSLGVHALIVGSIAFLTRHQELPAAPTLPQIDTRVTFGPEPAREVPQPIQVAPPPPEPESPATVEPPPAAVPPPSPMPQDSPVATGGVSAFSGPQSVSVPAALPDSMRDHVRRFASDPAPITDPAVRPAAAVSTARPAHGALAAGQHVVYLLDASGSMGEWGKFTAARDVFVATAAVQPAGVGVKVVVYAATAEVVAPAALATRTPVGRGDHLAGLRLALAQSPDVIVWFTDAADLPTAAVDAQLRRAGKPVALFVARVGPDGVAAPAALR